MTPLGLAVVALFGCPQPERGAPQTAVGVTAARTPENPRASSQDPNGPDPSAVGKSAQARLIDREGNVVGKATLYPVPGGVEVRFEGRGLSPGSRAFHVHERGACNPADDFDSAGSHWSPYDREHGLANPEGAHMGDMPNLQVEEDGTAELRWVLPGATLQPEGKTSLLEGDGTALVIHAGPDDHETDPAGGAGDRIACGVIETAPAS